MNNLTAFYQKNNLIILCTCTCVCSVNFDSSLSSITWLQNEEVLKLVTYHNVRLNSPHSSDVTQKCRFFSGDWASVDQVLQRDIAGEDGNRSGPIIPTSTRLNTHMTVTVRQCDDVETNVAMATVGELLNVDVHFHKTGQQNVYGVPVTYIIVR